MGLRDELSLESCLAYLSAPIVLVVVAQLGLVPGVGEAGGAQLAEHPYRVSMAVAVTMLAVGVGLATGWAARRASWYAGLALLLVMGMITGGVLAFAPAILYPNDRYPVTFMWLLLGAPIGFVSWAATTVAVRAREDVVGDDR